MEADFIEYLVSGRFGPIAVGSPWPDVEQQLGPAPLIAPQDGATPGFARYGSLQFTIRDGIVTVIALDLSDEEVELPAKLVGLPDYELLEEEVAEILKRNGVLWRPDPLACDDRQRGYSTDRGVELTFVEGLLARVGAADPEWVWGRRPSRK